LNFENKSTATRGNNSTLLWLSDTAKEKMPANPPTGFAGSHVPEPAPAFGVIDARSSSEIG
jgi:hypothetical protein